MSRAAREHAVSTYSVEVVGQLYERLYCMLLDGEVPAALSHEQSSRKLARNGDRRTS
jgi:hypothetical protein